MAKIKLGARPETFAPFPVKFTMPDGSEGVINPTYRYRTRKEFGAMLNEMFSAAGEEQTKEGPIDFEKLFAKSGGKNAKHLHSSLFAWDLDEEITIPNLEQFADELPAGAAALMSAYNTACNEGRLGNL